MATHKQALKRHRQSVGRAERNNYYKATMRTYIKAARLDLANGDKDAAGESVARVSRYLDRVASRGVIPKLRASRVKSRLNKALAAL
ncbi:MAG: 30S ribosomal protein S20 [Deltaproteobacteria bacterium]|nr:30S ribosomal protein S20 [Deltaproteobacteria bacterium]